MNRHSKITPFPQEETELNENKWVLAALRNKNRILWTVGLVVFSGLALGGALHKLNRFQNRKTSLAYESLDPTKGIQSHANLKEVYKIATKYKFMQPHLDAPLAQAFLNEKNVATSKKVIQRVEARLNPNLNAVFAFNQITLLIAEKQYEEALKECYNLNEKMDESQMPVLFEYQFLRTALLEKKIYQREIQRQKDPQKSALILGQLSLQDFLMKDSL